MAGLRVVTEVSASFTKEPQLEARMNSYSGTGACEGHSKGGKFLMFFILWGKMKPILYPLFNLAMLI